MDWVKPFNGIHGLPTRSTIPSLTDWLADVPLKAALEARADRKTPLGREYALPTGRFRAAESHWLLWSDESRERTDAARPATALRPLRSPVSLAKAEQSFDF
jgi:hypothetical protein